VHLSGVIAGGTNGTVAFTVPRAVRPAHSVEAPVVEGGGFIGIVSVNPDGIVIPVSAPSQTGSATDSTSLDEVTYSLR
jgi:hypothetical protein